MYLLAPFIFAVLFMILVAFSSCIFKIIFKIKSFTGFCSGVCCSFLTSIIASIYMSIIMFLIMKNLKPEAENAANNNYTPSTNTVDINKYFNYTKFGLFLLWLFFVILMAIAFFFIFFFTKRVSKPEDDYNSVFMFISGYILLPFIFFYLIWMIICAVVNDTIAKLSDYFESEEAAATFYLENIGSFFFTLIDFVGLQIIFLLSGAIIMCMLHHRKVNSFIIFICLGCFFAPAIFLIIFFYTLETFFITYLLILPSFASLGLGIFFYLKYAVQVGSIDGYAQPQASYQLVS